MKHSGEVTGVRQHHKGKHVVVDIAHGKRSPKKKGKSASPYDSNYDDRPNSSIVVPKSHAAQFGVGRRVAVHVTPEPDDDGDMGEDLDQMDSRLRKGRKR
jgi:hypothetical protein